MKTLNFLCVCAFAFAVFSCSTESGNDDAYYAGKASISSDDSSFTAVSGGGTIAFKSEGGQVTVYVDCGTEWTAEKDGSNWLGLYLNCDSGTLTVTAEQNTVEEERTASITLVTAAAYIEFATIAVTQNAYGAPEITVSANAWHVPAVGALTTEIEVIAPMDYEVDSFGEWLSVEKTASGISLTAQANGATEERTTQVELFCTDGIHSSTERITVSQDGLAYINVSTETLAAVDNGDTTSVTVTSNFDWDYSYDISNGWFTAERGGDILTVTITADRSDEGNEGVLILTAGDGAENVTELQLKVIQYGLSDALILEYTTTSSRTAVQLPITGEVDCVVDWGDGESETVTSSFPEHFYSNAGVYEVNVIGKVSALCSGYFNSDGNLTGMENITPYLTAVKQWGNTGLTDMTYALAYCTKLTSIPTDTAGSFSKVTSFYSAFYRCLELGGIPAGLFDYCSEVETFYIAFYYCYNVPSIPDGLFDNCLKANDFGYTFFECQNIAAIPAGLFDNCPEITNFEATFYDCRNVASIPEGLFDKCTKVTSFYYTFVNCWGIKSIPAGLFDNCPHVTTFSSTFYYCDGVSAIPEGLFDNCPEVTNFDRTFYYCSALTSIPMGLFDKNTKAETFNYTFYNCKNLTGESPYTLIDGDKVHLYERSDEKYADYFTEVAAYNNCFYRCSGLDDYEAITEAGWN